MFENVYIILQFYPFIQYLFCFDIFCLLYSNHKKKSLKKKYSAWSAKYKIPSLNIHLKHKSLSPLSFFMNFSKLKLLPKERFQIANRSWNYCSYDHSDTFDWSEMKTDCCCKNLLMVTSWQSILAGEYARNGNTVECPQCESYLKNSSGTNQTGYLIMVSVTDVASVKTNFYSCPFGFSPLPSSLQNMRFLCYKIKEQILLNSCRDKLRQNLEPLWSQFIEMKSFSSLY